MKARFKQEIKHHTQWKGNNPKTSTWVTYQLINAGELCVHMGKKGFDDGFLLEYDEAFGLNYCKDDASVHIGIDNIQYCPYCGEKIDYEIIL